MKNAKGVERPFLIAGQITKILYWLSENAYILAKLRVLLVGERNALYVYCVVGVVCYLETIAYNMYILLKHNPDGEGKGLNSEKVTAALGIIKDTIDNISLLPYFGIGKDCWALNLSGSVGCCLSAVLSIYLNQ